MARARKSGKSPETPTGIRLTEEQKKVAKQAAKLESDRRKKPVGWTTLVGDKGIEWCQRRVRRAIKESAA